LFIHLFAVPFFVHQWTYLTILLFAAFFLNKLMLNFLQKIMGHPSLVLVGLVVTFSPPGGSVGKFTEGWTDFASKEGILH